MAALTFLTRDKLQAQGVLRMDQHIHTVYSDGASKPVECVQAAKTCGLNEIAFTDHVWRSSDWVEKYAHEIRCLRQVNADLRIIIGLEAKAVDFEGNVDVSYEATKEVDFVMGVVHRNLPDIGVDLARVESLKAAELETRIALKLLDNPIVTVIGHPTRTYYKFFYPRNTKELFPDELLKELFAKAKNTGKAIELNEQLLYKERMFRLMIESDIQCTLGSDAHKAEDIGRMNYANTTKILLFSL